MNTIRVWKEALHILQEEFRDPLIRRDDVDTIDPAIRVAEEFRARITALANGGG